MTSTETMLAPESDERVLSTLNEDGSRRWIRPKLSPGAFWRARVVTAWVLIAIFVLVPYIKVAGKPLILLDIMAGEFTFFGRTFFATDTFLLMLLLLAIATGIFFVTALLGRVWCGWACPQTVYMEFLFRPIERWIEGGHKAQLKLDREGPNLRRVLKLPIFLLLSMFAAHTFLAYFVGVDQLFQWVRQPPTEHPVAFMVMAFVTAAMFFDFTYFREQTCLVACPYGRFQSVLLDSDSMIVGYDESRGEPRGRGAKRKAEGEAPKGDCVDCHLCVDTCPTGIDIRDGLQMECIGCTQCIDACNVVMDRVGKPRGLIRYSSQKGLAGKKTSILRPRVVIYGVLLTAAIVSLATLALSSGTDVNIFRVSGSTFDRQPDGRVVNSIRVKLTNHRQDPRTYTVTPIGMEGAEVVSAELPLTVEGRAQGAASGFVTAPPELFKGSGRIKVTLKVADDQGWETTREVMLLGPAGGQ